MTCVCVKIVYIRTVYCCYYYYYYYLLIMGMIIVSQWLVQSWLLRYFGTSIFCYQW
jgi:hypothetical protein